MTRREWFSGWRAPAGCWPSIRRPCLPTRRAHHPGHPPHDERLPIVGLGSSATFAQVARSEDVNALRAVLGRMVELGGTVFDTAPAYGASEEVAGRMAQELGIAKKMFWATKLNVAARGGGTADPRRRADSSRRPSGGSASR